MKIRLTFFLLSLFLLKGFVCYGQQTVTIPPGSVLPHPRLLFTGEEQRTLLSQYASDPLFSQLQQALFKEADRLLTAQPQTYTLRDMNYVKEILMISREQLSRMITLSLAYRLSGDTKYAAKVESELVNVCDFPNWNPQHYLDVSEMTTAVSIAYDWCYEFLSPETRKKVEESIRKNALNLVIEEYKTGGPNSWAKRETNWNVVCNTGMVLGALAVADVYPEYLGPVVSGAVRFMPNCLKHLAPDGVCYEGPGYWGYTNSFLALFLKAVNDNLGQDYGISSLDGVARTALYYVDSTSPSGKVFNFANSGNTDPDEEPTYFFFSRFFDQPKVAAYYRNVIANVLTKEKYPRLFFLSIPWFDDSSPTAQQQSAPLTVYRGINDIAVFQGKREVPNSLYLIAKGGDPDEAHQQLDVGTFIVESNGIRWSDDLGADNYDLPGFWDYRPNGRRWNYFRNTNLSHNTLSIDNKIQHSGGRGDIIAYDTEVAEPYVTFDMTTVYKDQAQSVLRTFRMIDDETMVVTDEVELMSASQTLTWHMITAADVRIEGQDILLTKDGRSCCLTVISPSDAVLSVETASAWSSQEKPVTGYKQLFIRTTGRPEQKIEVKFSAGKDL